MTCARGFTDYSIIEEEIRVRIPKILWNVLIRVIVPIIIGAIMLNLPYGPASLYVKLSA